MADKLTEELLRRILAGESVDGLSLGRGNYTGPQITEANDGSGNAANYEQVIYGNGRKDGQTNTWDTWETDGTYRGSGSGDSDLLSGLKFLGTALAGYYGVNALGGGAGGAAAGAPAGNGAFLGEAAWSPTAAGIGAEAGTAGGALGTTGVNAMRAGEIASYAPGAAATSPAVANGLSTAAAASGSIPDWLSKNIGGLAGAALGAASSQDQQQTTTRDPWKPAQPFLQQQIDQGMALSKQYADQPFSPQQQTAYNNFGGLLNAINGGAGGLLQGMNANASGANNYDRSNPRRALTGSSFDLSGFAPGLLQFFPQSKG